VTAGPRKAPGSVDLAVKVTVREASGLEAEALRGRQLAALARLLRVAVERRRAQEAKGESNQNGL